MIFLTTSLVKKYEFMLFYFRDLGAQIDGFIAVAAHTVVVGASTVGIESAVVFGDSLESIYLVSDCVEPEENKSNHCLWKKLEHCFISENLQTQFIYAVTMV